MSNMKSAEEWNINLLQEHERAIKQRDTYILTGRSTASHGGSHDTCFKRIIEQIQIDAYKAGMSESAEITRQLANDVYRGAHVNANDICGDIRKHILSARNRKETI